MNMTLKRFVCFLLIFCLLNTLPGCATVNGQPTSLLGAAVYVVGGLLRVTALVVGDLIIVGIVWGLDKITWPLYRFTGFNMDGPATAMFRFYNNLIDPNHIHGDWDTVEAELHDAHPWDKDNSEESEVGEDVLIQTGDPTGPSMGEAGIPDTDKGLTATITYDATGGFFAPEDQIIYTGLDLSGWENIWNSAGDTIFVPKISEQKPVKSGYHFVGWTDSYNPKDDGLDENYAEKMPRNEIKYLPGEKVNSETGKRITEDITLYAVWQKHEYIWRPVEHIHYVNLATKHKYTITEEHKRVTVTCDCGMILRDPYITEAQFLYLKYDDTDFDGKKDIEETKRHHKLYLAQDIGPHALHLNTSLYNEESIYAQRFDEIVSEFESDSNLQEGIFNQFCTDMDHLSQEIFPTKKAGEAVGDIFSGVKTGVNVVWKLLTITRATYAANKLINRDNTLVTKTIAALDIAEAAASFFIIRDVATPYFDTLEAALKLIGKMDVAEEARMNIYGNLLPNNRNKSEYLTYIFDKEYPYEYLSELVTGGERGCYCKSNPRFCDFSYVYPDEDLGETRKDVKQPLEKAPSVEEVYIKMCTYEGEEPTDLEKEMVMFYLAERSEHELYLLSGLTLQEYAELVK